MMFLSFHISEKYITVSTKTTLRCAILFHFLFLSSLPVNAQSIKEEIFPRLPYKDVSSFIGVSSNGFYVYGTTGQEVSRFPYDLSYVSQPYFILSPDRVDKKVLLLPELASNYSWGTGGQGTAIYSSAVMTTVDSFFVLWHSVGTGFNDVPPNYLFADPVIHLAKQEHDSLRTILTHLKGWYPSIACDSDQSLHLIWEDVTPLDSMWGYFYSKYSSRIVYRKRGATGEFSTPVEIGKGFFPSVNTRGANVHILFFAADSSNQGVMSITYARLNGGVLTGPLPLQAVAVNPYPYTNPYRLQWLNPQWSVDATDGIHLAWRDLYEGTRWHLVHYSKTGRVQVDSLDVVSPRIRIMNDGTIKIFGVEERAGTDSTDFQYYVSAVGRPVQKIRTLSFLPYLSLTQILVDTAGIEHAILTGGSRTYLLQYASADSAKLVPLASGYAIQPTAFVTKGNVVWLTGKRDSTNVILHFALNDVIVSVQKDDSNTPDGYALNQNYPNPFNPTTAISYQLSAVSVVTLDVFDILGRKIATLIDATQSPGAYVVKWDGSALSSGVYFYRLRARDDLTGTERLVETKKMLLLR